jgi:hypothetical protein
VRRRKGSRAAESLIDQAIALKAIGGVHDRQTPTEFMCLTLKLLQLQPEREILIEYLLAEEFKWVLFLHSRSRPALRKYTHGACIISLSMSCLLVIYRY